MRTSLLCTYLLLVLLLVACEPLATPSPTATPAPTITRTPPPTSTPTPASTHTPTITPSKTETATTYPDSWSKWNGDLANYDTYINIDEVKDVFRAVEFVQGSDQGFSPGVCNIPMRIETFSKGTQAQFSVLF